MVRAGNDTAFRLACGKGLSCEGADLQRPHDTHQIIWVNGSCCLRIQLCQLLMQRLVAVLRSVLLELRPQPGILLCGSELDVGEQR